MGIAAGREEALYVDVEVIDEKEWYVCQCKSQNMQEIYLKKDYTREFALDDFSEELEYYGFKIKNTINIPA